MNVTNLEMTFKVTRKNTYQAKTQKKSTECHDFRDLNLNVFEIAFRVMGKTFLL